MTLRIEKSKEPCSAFFGYDYYFAIYFSFICAYIFNWARDAQKLQKKFQRPKTYFNPIYRIKRVSTKNTEIPATIFGCGRRSGLWVLENSWIHGKTTSTVFSEGGFDQQIKVKSGYILRCRSLKNSEGVPPWGASGYSDPKLWYCPKAGLDALTAQPWVAITRNIVLQKIEGESLNPLHLYY